MIQTFPVDFKLPGCKSDVEQVIGNAVPVQLAQYVASRLLHYIHIRALESRDELLMPCQLFEPRPLARAKLTPSEQSLST